jgi:HK97 family phage portal protein
MAGPDPRIESGEAIQAFDQVDKSATGAALPSSGYLPTLGSTPSATGLNISQGTAMAVSGVYCCVTIRSQDVARCKPSLYTRGHKRRKKYLVENHPLAEVLRRPNRQQTWFEWMEQMQTGHLLRGNAYAAIKRQAPGHKVSELVPINPDAVLVLESWDGTIFYNVNRIGMWQIAMLREFPSSIAEEDIFHLRGVSFNSLMALSTIGMARDAIGVSMGLEQQTARQMANGARPSMVLEMDGKLSEDTAKRLGQQFRDAFGGIRNTGGVPILEQGIKANQLQLTSVDMEFMAQRSFQLADIARFYKIPQHKLGTDQLRGVNIVQVNQDYVNNTVMPDLHRWEEKFDQVFSLAEQDLEIDFDETVLLRADIATRFTANRIALGGGAFVTVNEVREAENLEPVDPKATGADQVTRPVNMASIGSDLTGTAPDGAGHPTAAEGGVPGADHVPSDRNEEEEDPA